MQYLNEYDCPCGESWEDVWSCQCDDRCPVCNTACSPSTSTDLAASEYVTRAAIDYGAAPYGHIATIPAGTPVRPASNVPQDGAPRYWCEPWPGIGERADSWQRNHGFLIEADQVEEVKNDDT